MDPVESPLLKAPKVATALVGRTPSPAVWLVMKKGKRKEGPFSIEQLEPYAFQQSMRIRRTDHSDWVAWENAGSTYPELIAADLVDPPRTKPEPQPQSASDRLKERHASSAEEKRATPVKQKSNSLTLQDVASDDVENRPASTDTKPGISPPIREWLQLLAAIIAMFVAAFSTWSLSRDGFSAWSILTGAIALACMAPTAYLAACKLERRPWVQNWQKRREARLNETVELQIELGCHVGTSDFEYTGFAILGDTSSKWTEHYLINVVIMRCERRKLPSIWGDNPTFSVNCPHCHASVSVRVGTGMTCDYSGQVQDEQKHKVMSVKANKR